MLVHLKKQLTILSGLSTSIIMTIVIILMFFISLNQSDALEIEKFNQNLNTLIEKIKYSNMVSHDYLRKVESENNLIIYIENKGYPLNYKGGLITSVDRKVLINKVKGNALKDGIDLSLNPITSSIITSPIYKFRINNEYYMGIECVIPLEKGWSSIIMVEYISQRTLKIIQMTLLYALIDIIACAILFKLSHIFIGKALKPVEVNQKRQTEFIAAASHELRSPLTVIKAALSSIKSDSSLTQLYLPNIESECTRMTRLINDMLLLANSDAKNWTLNKESLDMDTLLIETYDLFCPLISSHNINFNLNLPDKSLATISGDKERIKQILTILLDNASEYTPSGKNITINAYNSSNSVIIEICDTGKGIPDEQKELIFNRFYRSDKSRTSKKHFGLGLNIALELIKLHNGHIKVKDTPGGGATFIIDFPLK